MELVNRIRDNQKKGMKVKDAIDEAVEIAKKYGQDNSGAFVNAILAKIVKLGD